MPANWMQRFVRHLDCYLESMQAEVPFKDPKNFPSLNDFLALREITIGVHAFLDLIEIQTDQVLPDEIFSHHYIEMLYKLSGRIFAWCNDFYSIEKDIGREPLNLILVLQHHYGLSLTAANKKALELHDADVSKLEGLQHDIPEMGIYTAAVKQFAWYLGVMIQGQAQWYKQDTQRYLKGGHPESDTFRHMTS